MRYEKLTSSILVKRIATLISGSVAANAIVLIAAPVLSRLYSPHDFGMLGLFVSVAAIMSTIICLRYEHAVYLPQTHVTANQLTVGAIAIAVTLALLLSFACAIWLLLGLSTPLDLYTLLLPLAALGIGLYNLLSNWAVRMQEVQIVARTRTARALIQVLTQGLLGLLGAHSIGLIAGELIGRMAGTMKIFRLFSRLGVASGNHLRPVKKTYLALREYWRFPLIATPTALLNVAVLHSPSILLATLYSPAAAGFYFMAQRLIAMPMALVGHSVAQGYTAEIAARFNRKDPQAASLFFRSAGWLLLAGAPTLIVIGLLAPKFMPILLGDNWHTAGQFILILTPNFIVQFVVSPLISTLYVLHKQHWQLIWDFFRLGCVIPAFILAARFGWSAADALLLFSCIMAGSYAFIFIVIWITLKRLGREGQL